MKLQEAYDILSSLVGDIINVENEKKGNKGKYGHAIEKLLHLNLGSHARDFEDGELKTCAAFNGKMRDDFKICKVWDKEYAEKKLENLLVLIYDYKTAEILAVKQFSILKHPIVRKQFDKDLSYLLAQPDINLVSQKDTDVFVAKTNGSGKKAINERALYIARAPASYLFELVYSGTKGKTFVEEMKEYEQTETRCAP